MISSRILQETAVIAKTTQTLIGQEVRCDGCNYVTLFFTYTKGDETGLDIQVHSMHTKGGTAYQDMTWTAEPGTKTATETVCRVTASGDYYITVDVGGIEFIKFTQGGSANDGTPTGTLAAAYTMKGM